MRITIGSRAATAAFKVRWRSLLHLRLRPAARTIATRQAK